MAQTAALSDSTGLNQVSSVSSQRLKIKADVSKCVYLKTKRTVAEDAPDNLFSVRFWNKHLCVERNPTAESADAGLPLYLKHAHT